MSKLIDARKNSEIDDDDVCEIAKVEEYWRVGGEGWQSLMRPD